MINRVVLVGRITKNLDLRKTQSGTSVVSFTIACNRRVPSQGQDADFINCVAWNKTADFMAQYVKKGALLGLEGRIQTRSYDDKDGKRVYITEVVADSVQFLESKKQAESVQNESYTAPVMQNNEYADYESDIETDDLPF
ncbi:MAG: single-stranded DNA-binding protein [Erysipelotrichaceae bacterium]|nr:single-stranded DNA-binding protein [Erysipelotrichaceae bacterium]